MPVVTPDPASVPDMCSRCAADLVDGVCEIHGQIEPLGIDAKLSHLQWLAEEEAYMLSRLANPPVPSLPSRSARKRVSR
jgi:hypothetical protein